MSSKEKKALIWLQYSAAAISGLSQVQEESNKGDDVLLDPEEIVETAADIADLALDEYESRFGKGTRSVRRKIVDVDDDEDEDEDDDTED